MLSRWVGFAAAFLLWWLPGAAPASAHDLPLDRFMNGFVRIEPHQADLVIRVPLDLLRAVSFALVRGHYDLAASQPAIKTALDALSSDLSLSENGRRLAPVRAAGTLAPLADRSFEDYGQAAAGIAAPPAPDARSRLRAATSTPISPTRSPRPNRFSRSRALSPPTLATPSSSRSATSRSTGPAGHC